MTVVLLLLVWSVPPSGQQPTVFAQQPTTFAQQPTTLRVTMFGDSVMLGARDALLAQFPGSAVTIDAQEDRSLLGAVGVMQAAQPLGDVVVLDLGYNDTDDRTVFRERIDTAMAVLAGVPRVIWLNQREFSPGRAGMNAELTAAVARYTNLDVVDWNAEVVAHPEDVYGDGIHLTPTGQRAMASSVRRAFDEYVASLEPTTTSTTPPETTPLSVTRPAATPEPKSSSPDDVPIIATAAGASILAIVMAVLVKRRRGRSRSPHSELG
jgi:lysophospholipase L1-like esterase